MLSRWYHIALINLLVAALLGLLMRFFFIQEVPGVKFMHVLFTHSHVALMGWGFLGMFALIASALLDSGNEFGRSWNAGFWLGQILVIGMLVSFPVQGYGPVSIGVSSLMLLVCYYLLTRLWKAGSDLRILSPVASLFLTASYVWFFLSTIGLWAMGPIVMAGWKGTAVYFMSIQFFLHFQINGWFLFGVIGLILQFLHRSGHQLDEKAWLRIFRLLVGATVLTYALAVSWSNPTYWVFTANSIGVLVQLAAMVLFFREILGLRQVARNSMSPWIFRIIGVALACLALKVLIQTAVVLPPIAVVAYTIRNFVIGFLHLMLLGMLTHFMLAEGFHRGYLRADNMSGKFGMYLFFAGFLITESLLFLQGLLIWFRWGFMPYFYEGLFMGSILLPLGIGLLLVSARQPDRVARS